MNNLYKVVKLAGMWRVVLASKDVVQFSSTVKAYCQDWVKENSEYA